MRLTIPSPSVTLRPRSHHFTPASIEVDALGRTIRSTERNGARPDDEITTESSYDIRGNLLTVVDALGRTAFRYRHDAANRPVRILSIDAGIKRTVLDALGNVVEQRDSKGALMLTAYDLLNRPVDIWARDNTIQPTTLRQHLVYGDNALQIGMSQSDARQRNALGQCVAHYDEAGRLVANEYDFKGNLLEKSRQVISDQELLSVFEGAGENNWQLSSLPDRLAARRAFHRGARCLHPGTDGVRDFHSLRRTEPGDRDRPIRETSTTSAKCCARTSTGPVRWRASASMATGMSKRIAHDAHGQRTLIAYGNGVMTRHAYDPHTFRLNRLRSEHYLRPDDSTYQPAGLPVQDFGYEYDLAGNIVLLRDRTPQSGIPDTLQGTDALDRRFGYDPTYRLLTATGRECDIRPALPPWFDEPRCSDISRARAYTQRYQYDSMGSLVVLQHQNEIGGFTREFAMAANANRLEMLRIGQTEFAYGYDAGGNMTSETMSRHFEWDGANRMKGFRTQTEGAEPSMHVQYLYDSGGQRVKKLVRRQGGQTESTHYIDLVFEHDRRVTAGDAAENNTLHVMDGESRIASVRVGSPFVDDSMPPIQFWLGDHLGSSNAVAGANGDLLSREEYTPYGETSFGSFARKRYRFQGKERDENGFNYHEARYYSPWLARWASVDPIAPSDGINPYVFAASNPMNFTDSSGMRAEGPAEVPSGTKTIDPHKCYDAEYVDQQVRNRQDFDNLSPEQKRAFFRQSLKHSPVSPPDDHASVGRDHGTSRPATPAEKGEFEIGSTGLDVHIQRQSEINAWKRDQRRMQAKLDKAILAQVGALIPGEAIVYLRTNLRTNEYYVGQTTTNVTRDEFQRQIEHDRRHGESFNYRVLWEGPSNELRQLKGLGGRRTIPRTTDLVETFFKDVWRATTNRSNPVNEAVWNRAVELGLVAASLASGTVTATYSVPRMLSVTQPVTYTNGRSRTPRPAPTRRPVRGR